MKKKGKISREEAKRMMWEYYREHRTDLPATIKTLREEILENIRQGRTAEESFSQSCEHVTAVTAGKKAA